jgi:CAAX prenyl protease-like protein
MRRRGDSEILALENLLTALLLTWILGLYEGRRVDDYGLPVRQAFGARFWEGFAVGVVNAKVGENVWDLVTLVALGIWTCYTVLRSGSLWLAVGYHAAFDYMQLFVIGTRNGSIEPVDHLLSTSFAGPDWVTGGVLGTEASFLMYPAIVLMFIYVRRRRFERQ